MKIKRVNEYNNILFSQVVLNQRGAFLVDDEPYEIEIISNDSAVVRGKNSKFFIKIIEEFRYYSPHITNFFDKHNKKIISFEKNIFLNLDINKIQPSQFYIDKDKIKALENFIRTPEDIVIQVVNYNNEYVCVDGHTRLFMAMLKNFKSVYAIEMEFEKSIAYFVSQAKSRDIFTIKDLKLVSNNEYEKLWIKYCDDYFSKL